MRTATEAVDVVKIRCVFLLRGMAQELSPTMSITFQSCFRLVSRCDKSAISEARSQDDWLNNSSTLKGNNTILRALGSRGERRVSPESSTVLFGLPGVGVRHVQHVASHPVVAHHRLGTPARLVHAVKRDPTDVPPRVCGVASTSVGRRRTTSLRDVAYGEECLAVC